MNLMRSKMLKNKKGFSLILAIGIGFFLAVLYVIFFVPGTKTQQPFIGNSQLELLKEDRMLQSQLALILEPIGEYGVQRAYTQLAYQGGYQDPEQSPCGVFEGYVFWKKGQKQCYPIRMQQEFLDLIRIILNEYIQSFEEFPEDNYDLRIVEEIQEKNKESEDKNTQQKALRIIGIAKKPLQRKTQQAVLAVSPSFSVLLPASPFDEYTVIIDAIKGREQPTKTGERGVFNYAELCDRYDTALEDCMTSWAQQKNEEEIIKAGGLFFEVGRCTSEKEQAENDEHNSNQEDAEKEVEARNIKFCVKSRQLGLAFDTATETYRLQPLVYRFVIGFDEKR